MRAEVTEISLQYLCKFLVNSACLKHFGNGHRNSARLPHSPDIGKLCGEREDVGMFLRATYVN